MTSEVVGPDHGGNLVKGRIVGHDGSLLRVPGKASLQGQAGRLVVSMTPILRPLFKPSEQQKPFFAGLRPGGGGWWAEAGGTDDVGAGWARWSQGGALGPRGLACLRGKP
jgi:hypothetical protein